MTSAPVLVRSLEPGELDAWAEGEWKAWGYRHGEAWRRVLETCEALVAEAEGELVGGAAHARFLLSVPGGRLPVSLVSSVWVAATSRRRGVFRRLVEAQLAGMAADGLPACVLIAAEPGMYRRFGFGVASLGSSLRIRRDRSGLAEASGAPGSLALVDRVAGVDAATAIYERLALRTPGMLDRSAQWWDYSFPREDAGEPNPTLFVLHEATNGLDGYAAYTVREGWTREGRPEHTLLLQELAAETPAAYEALWSYCLDLSLCGWIKAENRPVDEPLLHMLGDPGCVQQSIFDALHVRLLDVPGALSTRRYSTSDELVIEVRDEAGGWAAGRWLLVGGGEGADCGPTSRSADLALDVSALGCAYLGAVSFDALRRAGRVDELAPGAVRRADALFSWSPAPWLPWDY